MGFVFYDTETTGTDTFYDQILQFAAIRTDAEVNEVDRFNIRCRIHPFIVPAPGAMKVTGVRCGQLVDPNLPSHYEMMRQIRAKLMSWSPSIFVGYNSLDFDEGLLRQAFYTTLHQPYLTNSHGNSRADMLRIAQAACLFKPDCISVPEEGRGKRIFKLERLAPANGFQHSRAHDALGDVEATIHICRLVAANAPDVWSSSLRFSQKAAVVDYVTNEPLFCLSDFYYNKPYSWFVTAIGQSVGNPNEWLAYDVANDPATLNDFSDEDLRAWLQETPKPVRRFKSNEAPIICAAEDAPTICKNGGCDLEALRTRAELLQSDGTLCARIKTAMDSLKKEYPASPHVEGQIYDGFFRDGDSLLMDAFHIAPWEERLAIVEQFQDARLKRIGRRLHYLERPELLSDEMRREHDVEASARVMGRCDGVSWTTLPDALTETDAMLLAAKEDHRAALTEHRSFLQQMLDRAAQFLAAA